MSDGNENPMKRGPTEVSHATGSVEKRQKVLGCPREENSGATASQRKLVQDFMASLKSSVAKDEAGEGEQPSSLSNEERKDRKRKINRLSAQRKRVRERVQLDTLTDRYAQLSYRNEALKGDNSRLNKLITSLKETLFEAKQRESSTVTSQQQPIDRSAYLLEKLGQVEKVRQSLIASVHEGQPARLNSLDPATGSAAGSTTDNPFVKTTNLLVAKVKDVDQTRQTLITVLKSVQQEEAPTPVSVGVNAGNVVSAIAINRAASQPWPVAQEIPVSLQSQLLSVLRAPAPPPVPTPAAAPNAVALLQLLTVLGGSPGNAQPNQVAVPNVARNYQGFQGAPSNMTLPPPVSRAVSVCSQPTRISLSSDVASCTTNTSQMPVGGSTNNSQVMPLAAILHLLQKR
jgi:hypothetical protein